MLVLSAGWMVRQGAVLVLAAGAVTFCQILNLALAEADSEQNSPSLETVERARAVTDAPAAPARLNGSVSDDPAQAGNPLWSLPLNLLSMTRERPIFSPSRRPPPPVLAAPYVPPPPPPPPPPKAAEPDHPLLTLLGALAGDTQGVGIFLNEADKTTLRLRTGEDHEGWVLRSIRGGEATFEKGERTATLTMAPLGSTAQTRASQTALGNTWRDGDGQMIYAPPRREPTPASQMAAPPHKTWLDGDDQIIGAPPQRPPSPPIPTTVDPVL